MAEDLTEYLHEAGLKVRYMHSDVETLERIELIRDLRLGVYDVLVGINLLREGLDIPECGLVAILDADKEGFLRSETSLIQTIGRAARNVDGRVILYADRITGAWSARWPRPTAAARSRRPIMPRTASRPTTIKRNIGDIIAASSSNRDQVTVETGDRGPRRTWSATICAPISRSSKAKMREAAADLEFEEAGRLRDEIRKLEQEELGLPVEQHRAPVRAHQRGQAGDAQTKYGKCAPPADGGDDLSDSESLSGVSWCNGSHSGVLNYSAL